MSLTDVHAEILSPMQAIFRPPFGRDEAAQADALRGYGTVLENFSREDLKAAWTEVVASHTSHSWPVPGVIVLAARKARKERAPTTGAGRVSTETSHTERWKEWERVRAMPIARRAVELGVAWSLRCAILNDGVTLHGLDIGAMQRAKAAAERTAAKIEAGEFIYHRDRKLKFSAANAETALNMWRNIQVQEAESEDEIMRHQPPERTAA